MLAEELNIFKKSKEIIKTLYEFRGNTRKHIQRNEYQSCINLAYQLLDNIYNANSDITNRKLYTVKIKKLCKYIEYRISLLQELKMFNTKQATSIVLKLQCIYNMANKWG